MLKNLTCGIFSKDAPGSQMWYLFKNILPLQHHVSTNCVVMSLPEVAFQNKAGEDLKSVCTSKICL